MLYKLAVLSAVALILQPAHVAGDTHDIQCNIENFVTCPFYTELRLPCTDDPCSANSTQITDASLCESAAHCCMIGGTCFQKIVSSTTTSTTSSDSGRFFNNDGFDNNGNPVNDLDPLAFLHLQGGNNNGYNNINNNLFGLGNNNLFGMGSHLLTTDFGTHFGTGHHQTNNVGGGFQLCLPPFPHQCDGFPQPTSMEQIRDMLRAPVDIPYCERLACSDDSSLESDILGCIGVPGCYYDSELSTLRRSYGASVLPGVPVCYVAVQNEKFHQLAEKQRLEDGGNWNGLFTNCFLKKHYDEIMTQDAGCTMLDMFDLLGAKPKRAGWEGITETECIYIGACWSTDHQLCHYPGKKHQPIIPTPPTLNDVFFGGDMYGQSLCHDLDVSSNDPDYLLSGYHTCRASGCSVDVEITQNTILYWLYQYIKSDQVPSDAKPTAWIKVLRGEIQASNYKRKIAAIAAEIAKKKANNQYFGQDHAQGQLYLTRYETYAAATNNQGGSSRHFSGIPDISQGFFGAGSASGGAAFLGSNLHGLTHNGHSDLHGLTQLLGVGGGSSVDNLFGGSFAPQCPYQSGTAHMFSSHLSGLTKAAAHCCKTNYCFNPKTEHFSYSGLSSYWGFWESWGSCTQTCSGGTRTRTRRCVSFRGEACEEGSSSQEEQCNTDACPYYHAWSAWSACSTTCGDGQRTRSRQCSGAVGTCAGDSQETKSCTMHACPVYGQWAAWSACSVTCGDGQRTRTRQCSGYCVGPEDRLQTQDCTEYCGTVRSQTTSGCYERPYCWIVKEHKCLDGNNNPSNYCREQFEPVTRQYCFTGTLHCHQSNIQAVFLHMRF